MANIRTLTLQMMESITAEEWENSYIKSRLFALHSSSCDDSDDIEFFPDETVNVEYSNAVRLWMTMCVHTLA